MAVKSENVIWVEIDEDGDETALHVEFTEDESLYEVGEKDNWDGRDWILKLKDELYI